MTPAWHVPLLYIDPRTPLQTEAHLNSYLFRYSEHFIRRYGHLAYRAIDTSVLSSFDIGDQSTHTHTHKARLTRYCKPQRQGYCTRGCLPHNRIRPLSVRSPAKFLGFHLRIGPRLASFHNKPARPCGLVIRPLQEQVGKNKNKGVHLPGLPSPSSTTSRNVLSPMTHDCYNLDAVNINFQQVEYAQVPFLFSTV